MTATTERSHGLDIRTELLKREETIELIRLAQRGDLEARNRIVEHNVRLVVKVASKFVGRTADLDQAELIQEGTLGLLRAIEKFEPERGHAFSTYAIWWIKQAVNRYIEDRGHIVRWPVHLQNGRQRLRRAETVLRARLGREPTDEELRAEANVTEEAHRAIRNISKAVYSLDRPLPLHGDNRLHVTLHDITPDPESVEPEAYMEGEEDHTRLVAALARLDPRERLVIVYRFGLAGHKQMKLAEVGHELGVTRERVRQIEHKARAKLKDMLTEQPEQAAD